MIKSKEEAGRASYASVSESITELSQDRNLKTGAAAEVSLVRVTVAVMKHHDQSSLWR